jgi:hypothetical protein
MYYLGAYVEDTDMLLICSSYLTSGRERQIKVMSGLVKKIAKKDSFVKKIKFSPAEITEVATQVLDTGCSDYAMAGYTIS